MEVMTTFVDRENGLAEEAGADLTYGQWSCRFSDHARFIALEILSDNNE